MDEREEKITAARVKQPIAELRRKAEKAVCKSNIWTQEELDWADAEAEELSRTLKFD